MGTSINNIEQIVKPGYRNVHLVIVLSFLMMFAGACNEKKDNNFEVDHSGALRTIMSGNLTATITLDSLESKPNLYALGAVENLKGELQIFDGESFNSKVQDNAVIVDSSFDQKAALLVYTQVPNWMDIEIPSGISEKMELEGFIEKTALENGISTEKPFPFLIEGTVGSLSWHVINWPEGDMEHTHQKHKNSGLSGTVQDKKVTILGFFSLHHKAVFTHHTTNVHMHFKTEDGLLAGHLDDLLLGDDMILKLPKK
ncbi:MAG: acetolactate decarboxylase [Flavobacteriaceae bacterium]|nr:acetolactate decarboxylase [Flavobacteriaceae bacterium]